MIYDNYRILQGEYRMSKQVSVQQLKRIIKSIVSESPEYYAAQEKRKEALKSGVKKVVISDFLKTAAKSIESDHRVENIEIAAKKMFIRLVSGDTLVLTLDFNE